MDADAVIFLVVFAVVAVGTAWGFSLYFKALKRERERPVCPKCETVLDPGARYCHRCGNKNLINRAQFIKDKGDAYAAKERLYKARELYDKLVQCVYCKKCGGEYSPDTRYCSNCGQRTIPLSREMIFKWLHSEMPQVVATREDFSRIEQTASPILGKKGRAVFALTKFVAKNLLRR